jgi:hypothetical protein
MLIRNVGACPSGDCDNSDSSADADLFSMSGSACETVTVQTIFLRLNRIIQAHDTQQDRDQ